MSIESKDASCAIYPLTFSSANQTGGTAQYLQDDATRALLAFFEAKGLPAIKEEDRRETWCEDWIAFQADKGLYATVLSPAAYSTRGGSFDLFRYARFLEVFAWCSPGHGYSLQVSFLGLFAILMGTNDTLKREAVLRLEAGELLAFGVSERSHGSDLMANEFRFHYLPQGSPAHATVPRRLEANGTKYYIGNSNVASIIATLGKIDPAGDAALAARLGRVPFVLAALRPARGTSHWSEQKIHTLGVRAAHVGAFEVKGQVLTEADIIAEGRAAWDAVFGTVTLGKFFLGFGSIGICEHALAEAAAHLRERHLYGKPAIDMGHLRTMMAEAYARLLAMKLCAYRTLDYIHAASADDRRYQLFCAVQKARVSTEGVKVMGLISECIGAKGFEADTYCEMALRDAALIPGLEGSMHINLGLAVQFLPRYFERPAAVRDVASLASGEVPSRENPYLMTARTGGTQAIRFGWFLQPYRAFRPQMNVVLFARQAATFQRFVNALGGRVDRTDLRLSVALGKCMATVVYGQLVAENATKLSVPAEQVDCIFALLVKDMNDAAMGLAAAGVMDDQWTKRMIRVPQQQEAGWNHLSERVNALR